MGRTTLKLRLSRNLEFRRGWGSSVSPCWWLFLPSAAAWQAGWSEVQAVGRVSGLRGLRECTPLVRQDPLLLISMTASLNAQTKGIWRGKIGSIFFARLWITSLLGTQKMTKELLYKWSRMKISAKIQARRRVLAAAAVKIFPVEEMWQDFSRADELKLSCSLNKCVMNMLFNWKSETTSFNVQGKIDRFISFNAR